MLSQLLIVAAACIYGWLGSVHLVFTFFSRMFSARNPDVEAGMKSTSPVLTSQSTMWKCWVGFNASHSLGILLFAGVYLLLAVTHMEVLRQTPALLWLAVATSFGYLALAFRYWFYAPMLGVLCATGCFVLSALLL